MTQPAPPHGFDAHTHLDYPAFDLDRDAVCRRARAAGIQRWIIAGAHPAHWLRVLACAKETNGYAVLGIILVRRYTHRGGAHGSAENTSTARLRLTDWAN